MSFQRFKQIGFLFGFITGICTSLILFFAAIAFISKHPEKLAITLTLVTIFATIIAAGIAFVSVMMRIDHDAEKTERDIFARLSKHRAQLASVLSELIDEMEENAAWSASLARKPPLGRRRMAYPIKLTNISKRNVSIIGALIEDGPDELRDWLIYFLMQHQVALSRSRSLKGDRKSSQSVSGRQHNAIYILLNWVELIAVCDHLFDYARFSQMPVPQELSVSRITNMLSRSRFRGPFGSVYGEALDAIENRWTSKTISQIVKEYS